MAVVDFSNAVLTPLLVNGSAKYYNNWWMTLYPYYGNISIYDSNGTQIIDSASSKTADTRNYYVIQFSGHMTASGTEMYIGDGDLYWKISNVTFSNGDTVDFKIKAQVS
jgi:hypothetical protein